MNNPPPLGYREEWVPEDPEWFRPLQPGEGEGHPCRGKNPRRCPNEPVAVMFRRVYRRGRTTQARWFYCADHLFGRRIEDGQLLARRLVPET
jgi:hypothetical protein